MNKNTNPRVIVGKGIKIQLLEERSSKSFSRPKSLTQRTKRWVMGSAESRPKRPAASADLNNETPSGGVPRPIFILSVSRKILPGIFGTNKGPDNATVEGRSAKIETFPRQNEGPSFQPLAIVDNPAGRGAGSGEKNRYALLPGAG
ncbi:hypothetical protein KM043_009859 [Ampulex compressa]|nr:hypothetical protein KM043_009859 [Ampulex compressa]